METCLLAAGVVILVVSLGLASASDLSNRTIPNACVVSAALAAMPLAVSGPIFPLRSGGRFPARSSWSRC